MLYRIQNLDLPDRPFFVLSPDGALTADFNSTLFNQDSDLLGSYSYPGAMPLEPNRAIIRNAHYIATSNGQRTLNCMMWLVALPFKQVKMSFTIDDTKTINYNLYYDLALISNQLKTLKLYQLVDSVNDGQLTFESIAAMRDYMTATTTGAKGEFPMVFAPYKNDGAYIDAIYEFEPAYIGTIVYTAGQKFTYTDGQIWTANTTTIAGDNPVSQPAKFDKTPATYPDNAFPASKIINRYERADDGSGSFIVDETFPVRQTQVPLFYIVYIFKRIAQFFGMEAQGEWLNEDEANKLVFWSNIPIGTVSIIPDYTYFMNDMLVSDFLKAMRTGRGLLIEPDPTRNIWIFESLANLEKSEVVDLQDLQTIDFRETGTQSDAYTIEETFDDKDAAFSDGEKQNPDQMVIGDLDTAVQITDIQLPIVTTKMVQEQSAVPVFELSPPALVSNWRIPYIKMPMAGSTPMDQVSTLNQGDAHAFGLRLLIYQGMQADDAGYLYPYLTYDNLDPILTGSFISTLSLVPFDLALSAIWNYYQYIFNSKPFEMVFEMTPRKFMDIVSNRRIAVRDPFNFTTAICLLDQNSVDFVNNKDKVTAKLTLYPKVISNNAAQVLPPVVIPPPPPPFDNGVVFVKIDLRPTTDSVSPIPPHYHFFRSDIWAKFYLDGAMTTPKDVTTLNVRVQRLGYLNSVLFDTEMFTFNVTSSGDEAELYPAGDTGSNQGGNSYVWIWSILSSPDYTVIP